MNGYTSIMAPPHPPTPPSPPNPVTTTQVLACGYLLALVGEFSSAKSAALGLPLEFHRQVDKRRRRRGRINMLRRVCVGGCGWVWAWAWACTCVGGWPAPRVPQTGRWLNMA